MKISIIVPFYHGNKYIQNLAKIIQENNKNLQGFKESELEWIIVKDSLDDEIDLDINNYDFGIKIIKNKKNVGVHKSRINGLKESSGEYILFLDQDDIISNDYCLSQIKKIGDNDVIIANGYYFWKNSGEKRVIYKSVKQQKRCFDLNIFLNYTCIVSPGLYLLRKDAIDKDWIERPLSYTGCDDAYLWILLILNKAKFAINEDKIYTHVYTGENASNNTEAVGRSILECTDRLNGKVPNKYIKRKYRAAKYYLKPKQGFWQKMLHIDYILRKRYYVKKFNKD